MYFYNLCLGNYALLMNSERNLDSTQDVTDEKRSLYWVVIDLSVLIGNQSRTTKGIYNKL